jgi:hypothetical protein
VDAHTRYGGLRAKRCLPTKFHPKTAHETSLKFRSANPFDRLAL